mmetsp:Transcript_27811/g.56243  ORF Transcript_27811/g.56243 Transcript_27811/m.56243 type:complete len:229 (-) Transcript_27811:398-1084(-)
MQHISQLPLLQLPFDLILPPPLPLLLLGGDWRQSSLHSPRHSSNLYLGICDAILIGQWNLFEERCHLGLLGGLLLFAFLATFLLGELFRLGLLFFLLLLLLLAIRLSLGPLHSLLRSLAGILHQPRIERLPRGGSREQFINTKRLGCFTVLGKMTSNEQNEDLAAVVSSAASGIILSRYVEMSLHQCQLGCGTATQRMGKSIQLLLTRFGISFQRYRPTFDLVDKITN